MVAENVQGGGVPQPPGLIRVKKKKNAQMRKRLKSPLFFFYFASINLQACCINWGILTILHILIRSINYRFALICMLPEL